MKCYNCGLFLPDDSEFCQYCGKKIETEISIQKNAVSVVVEETTETAEVDLPDLGNSTPKNTWNTIVKIQTEETVKNLNENKKEKRAKSRFCKFCGGKIDEKTKKCSGCGKQYFKGIKFNKFLTTVLILSLVIISSVILNIVQLVKTNELNVDIEYYKQKTEEKQMRISELNKEISEKENHLNYYEKYAAIVPDDGSKKYHIHGCKDLDSSTPFWIYNYNAAEERGYSACSICYPKKLTLDELNKKYGVGQ